MFDVARGTKGLGHLFRLAVELHYLLAPELRICQVPYLARPCWAARPLLLIKETLCTRASAGSDFVDLVDILVLGLTESEELAAFRIDQPSLVVVERVLWFLDLALFMASDAQNPLVSQSPCFQNRKLNLLVFNAHNSL